MGSMSIVYWMIVIDVVVLLFGRNRISGLMEDVVQRITESMARMHAHPQVPQAGMAVE